MKPLAPRTTPRWVSGTASRALVAIEQRLEHRLHGKAGAAENGRWDRTRRRACRQLDRRSGAAGRLLCAALPVASLLLVGGGCRTAGHAWLNEPVSTRDWGAPSAVQPVASSHAPSPDSQGAAYSIAETPVGGEPVGGSGVYPGPRPRTMSRPLIEGRILGKFRNTYYDFPSEADHSGPLVELKSPSCDTIESVPRGFFEAVCVQGSGMLADGHTVSFAKRDCSCAEICPRTGQRICFDKLSRSDFPWGRGATGKPITPLLTVAVDSSIIPLGTPLYIPEFDGLPRDPDRRSFHDGCFVAQDRGLKVQGKQVDIFTGHASMTKLWNRLVPSNAGVRVVVDNPRCARAQ